MTQTDHQSQYSTLSAAGADLEYISVIVHTQLLEPAPYLNSNQMEYHTILEDGAQRMKTDYMGRSRDDFHLPVSRLENKLQWMIKKRIIRSKDTTIHIRVVYYLKNENKFEILQKTLKNDNYNYIKNAHIIYCGRYSDHQIYKKLISQKKSEIINNSEKRRIVIQLIVIDQSRMNIFIPEVDLILIDPFKQVKLCNQETGVLRQSEVLLSLQEFEFLKSIDPSRTAAVIVMLFKYENKSFLPFPICSVNTKE